jgi:thiol-disulfide isomerase/thioredoxin
MNRGLLIALAIGLAAATGFFVQQNMPSRAAVVAVPAGVTPDAAPETAGTGEPPAQKIPELLPQFQLADSNGKKRSLKEWTGQPVMVNFWATWCPPCRKEIPLLNELRKERASQRLEIVGIAVDFRDDVLKYAQETAINYPMLIGEEDGMDAMKAFGMEGAGFPFTFFADSRQRIVAMKLGELHRDEADLILDTVMAVDAGKLELAAAREQITAGMKEISTRRKAADAAAAAKKAR